MSENAENKSVTKILPPEQWSPVAHWAARLFANGLEGWTVGNVPGSQGNVSNEGGGKIFAVQHKGPGARIRILNPNFERVINNIPAALYTISRIELSPNGNPLMTTGGRYNRVDYGLLLHFWDSKVGNQQIEYSAEDVQNFTKVILEGVDQNPNTQGSWLDGRIAVAQDLFDMGVRSVAEITNFQVQVRDPFGGFTPGPKMELNKAILIQVVPGPAESAAWWTQQTPGRQSTLRGPAVEQTLPHDISF